MCGMRKRSWNVRQMSGRRPLPQASRSLWRVSFGRAGMAAIVAGDDFDLAAFAAILAKRLPPYAHPLFVRISTALDSTETFKQKKHALAREGFDPAVVRDPLYFRSPESGVYTALDPAAYSEIAIGAIRL